MSRDSRLRRFFFFASSSLLFEQRELVASARSYLNLNGQNFLEVRCFKNNESMVPFLFSKCAQSEVLRRVQKFRYG